VNDPPTGTTTIASKPCAEGGEVTFDLTELTTGVNDVDGGALSVSAVVSPTPGGGTVAIVAGGVKYTDTARFLGTDTFTFTLSDGNGGNITRTAGVDVGARGGAWVDTASK
jgi:D-serine deaminase-like pyridoxal phosphate-dependent protein